VTPATTFDLLAEEVESFDGLRWSAIPAEGQLLPGREPGEGAA
jgi:hypothetical protein